MADIFVKYNNTRIFPTPLVNHNYEMVDLNNGRWGNVEPIELQGYLTGIKSTGDYSRITALFTGNFGTLTVADETGVFYNWNTVAVDEISFDASKWPINGFVNYRVKLKAYHFPSGVIDASNQYEFTQNNDGTVSVNHRISAKGVNANNFGALDNAIAFVSLFTGKNPFNSCIPSFVPVGNGVLTSLRESIDRLTQTYNVTETYKYSTGSFATYFSTENLTIDESSTKDYVTLDYNVKYFASPITGNLNSLSSGVANTNYNSRLASIYGIDTTNIYKNTLSFTQDTGAATIETKINYISGLSLDASGYFDYTINLQQDDVELKQIWKVNGELITKGPISFRQQNVAAWKLSTLSNNGNYETFLYNLLINSDFQNFYVINSINPRPTSFTIDENSGSAIFKLSATWDDVPNKFDLINPKFEIQFQPPKWAFDLLPSANIEGHYVVQDLQMQTAPRATLVLSAGTSGNAIPVLVGLNSQFNNLLTAYLSTGFLVRQNVSSGINEISQEYEFLGNSILNSSDTANYKVFGAFSSDYIRPAGYKFGY